MPNTQHPEFPVEQNNLVLTIKALDARLEAIATGSYDVTTDDYSRGVLIGQAEQIHGELKDQRGSPYFGRIDFQASDEEYPESYYIGYVGFEHNGKRYVYDWQAGIAAVYNQARPEQNEYTYRNKRKDTVTGNLFLKRALEIERQQLHSIADHYDRRSQQQQPRVIIVDPDEYLAQVLEGKQDIQLQDIVKTIQRHQDELVRADAKQVLAVQGAAGSGKTSIALQRLAYLLYPDLENNINSNQCIVFGPNRLFLGYVAGLLPRLRVRGIAQKTLADWEADTVNIKETVVDKTLDLLLSPKAKSTEKEAEIRTSQFKTSLEMGQLLDRFVELRRNIHFPSQGWRFEGIGRLKLIFELNLAELVELYETGRHLPFNKHREEFIRACHARLAGKYQDAITRGSREFFAPAQSLLDREQALLHRAEEMEREAELARKISGDELNSADVADALLWGADGSRELAKYYRRQANPRLEVQKKVALSDEVRRPALDQLATAVRAKVDQILPLLSLPQDYYALLRNRELLNQLAPEHVDKFDNPTQLPLTDGSVDRSDLPAMMYLYFAVNGIQPSFEHVIVDEAQDVAPLEFELLRRSSRNQSFTIMGDLAQGIYSHRGITSWNQISQVFRETPPLYKEINTSYRSTFEILTMARRVLETMQKPDSRIGLPQPIARRGSPPKFHHLTDPTELEARLWQVVLEERKAKHKNIAIICKSVADCKSIERSLKKVTNEELSVATSADFKYDGGVLILPVHLAKGMEFEVVMLANVDHKTYSSDEFDGRLLYVAITRALHMLHLFWSGQVSIHLKDVVSG